jgi:hypothetical protein
MQADGGESTVAPGGGKLQLAAEAVCLKASGFGVPERTKMLKTGKS